ncbi:ABC transporter substrate-binding protein [Bacillus sp. REN16]|uniref:ABC transporter substrate-binding protein n=1 Tax=Bacillus sp. REN16 TaxID=2887296 RepID=UPI001E3300D3|nr:ABC transporter substrate-binding protein [Bacillus sp. REN16]MCC3356776.1 ABC transporter substrate-binding protein [Bacillus sp. REN16]
MKKVLSLILVLFVILSGCSSKNSSNDGEKESSEKELVVAQISDASTMDPQNQGSMPDMNILINIFDTLVTRDENNELAPSLATEWEAIDDTTWQFKLRDDVVFHNGEKFNAETVKFSIERLNSLGQIVELRNVKEVNVVDEYTVNIVTEAPDPILPNKTVLFGGVMVPKQYIEEKGEEHFAKNPVGTGPFKFISWKKDNEVVLEANGDYWRGAPNIDKLVFKTIPNVADMVAAAKTGEIDIATGLTSDVAIQLEGDPNLNVVAADWIRTFYLVIDTTKDGPLGKKEVRQAINHAVNVQQIIDTVLGGYAKRVATLIPSQNFGNDSDIKPFEYDLEKAKELLKEAGYPDGFEVDLDAANTDSAIVQAIAAELEKVGIKVKVNLMDRTTLMSNITAKTSAPLYYLGNTGWTMDAISNFQSYIKSDRRYNVWKNDEADQLMDVQEQNIDPAIRQEALTGIQELLIEEAPYVYLWQLDGLYAMGKDVEWKPNVIGVLNMYNASVK